MNITAQNIYDLYVTDECAKRLHLRYKHTPEKEPDPFQEVLFDLGKQHEKKYLKSLGPCTDLSILPIEAKIRETNELISDNTPLIYQGAFQAEREMEGVKYTLTGNPDFLILLGDSYIIRDAKMAKKINLEEDKHTEIIKQMQLYGYIFHLVFGKVPAGLEVLTGQGEIISIPYDNGETAKLEIAKILNVIQNAEAPYSPVGWTCCNACGFKPICWKAAMDGKNVAIIPEVDKGTATALHNVGVDSIDELFNKFNEGKLSVLNRPWGKGLQKVGKRAEKIFMQAKAIKSGKHTWLQILEVPPADNYVMFDLEGMPPYLDEIDTIYLWGMKVYGKRPGKYMPSVSSISETGDREAWDNFLNICSKIFKDYGNIPFVHYSHYEKTKLKLYTERYGDRDGIAERVVRNLFDLLPATKKAVILAAPSYSLKVVEQAAGFKRSQKDYGGLWSMAQYIKAVETRDASKRDELMKEILVYNEEDLIAMWEVMQWLIKNSLL